MARMAGSDVEGGPDDGMTGVNAVIHTSLVSMSPCLIVNYMELRLMRLILICEGFNILHV